MAYFQDHTNTQKGAKHHVENYRPVANLCSTSKIFERLILKRIQVIELDNNADLTGKQQHGFKKGKSTTSLALQLQSLIARALDDDNFVLMASLDLSAAFDVVDIGLLMQRLRIIGLPEDILSLIEIWLRNRVYYVEINGHVSKLFLYRTWNNPRFNLGSRSVCNLCLPSFRSNRSF